MSGLLFVQRHATLTFNRIGASLLEPQSVRPSRTCHRLFVHKGAERLALREIRHANRSCCISAKTNAKRKANELKIFWVVPRRRFFRRSVQMQGSVFLTTRAHSRSPWQPARVPTRGSRGCGNGEKNRVISGKTMKAARNVRAARYMSTSI